MPVTHVAVSIPDAATYTVLANNAGVMHYFPDFTATCTATLPTPKAGLWFEFIYKGVAADAQNFVITTGSDTNYFVGGVLHLDTDAGAGSDELVTVYPDGNSNSKLTLVTPGAATRIRVECQDGTLWVVSGYAVSATVPTFADQ